MPASRLPPNVDWPGLYLDPALFEAQLKALKKWGWRTITARQLALAIRSGRAVPRRSIVLTFDDGARDNYTYAYPILERYGYKATFFVIARRIGGAGKMTARQLRDLAAHGHELGNHTWTHADLGAASYATARREIRRASDRLEALSGVPTITLAYPYGSYDATAMRAAAAEGIDLALTTEWGVSESPSTRLDEQRVRIFGYVRNGDGTYSGGTTAGVLMRTLSRYEGPIVTAPVTGLSAGVTLHLRAPVRTTWSGRDPTGIQRYVLVRSANKRPVQLVALPSRTSTGVGQSLALGATYRYALEATNDAGATRRYARGPWFRAQLAQEDSCAIAFSGAWSTRTSGAWSGGASRSTVEPGASVSYTFTGYSVAWVAAVGPSRGSADVFLDGAFVATVSLHAPRTVLRRIVYAASRLADGSHTLRIVNEGAGARPRLDVDGFLRLETVDATGVSPAYGPGTVCAAPSPQPGRGMRAR